MIFKLKNSFTDSHLFAVPIMNFGQMQRWIGHEQLKYSLEVDINYFLESFNDYFEQFRKEEIEEDDPEDFEELINFKNIGRPNLKELIENHHELLNDLLIFNRYEVLHSIVKYERKDDFFYSINSLDKVLVNNKSLILSGICFKVERK